MGENEPRGGRLKKALSHDRFARLETSLQQALQHARSERHDLRTTVLPAPPAPMQREEIVQLRQQLNYS